MSIYLSQSILLGLADENPDRLAHVAGVEDREGPS